MKLSGSNIKKIPCILSQKKKLFLDFAKRNPFLYFQKRNPTFSNLNPKKLKKHTGNGLF